jgi:predicted amidophosphoribosyltransferase
MEDIIIWAMCPYCESEVELYGTGDETCPRCGATFTPSEEEIKMSLENQ